MVGGAAHAHDGSNGMGLQREGCMHGELDDVYASIRHLEEENGIKVDLLICCGDFQAIRKQRHKWEYTQATEFEMAKVRNLQKWEQQQGTAVDTPTTYLQLSSK